MNSSAALAAGEPLPAPPNEAAAVARITLLDAPASGDLATHDTGARTTAGLNSPSAATLARIRRALAFARLSNDFRAMLDELPLAPLLGDWAWDYSRGAFGAWTDAAAEAYDLPNGNDLLPAGVTLGFRDEISVRFVRKCYSDHDENGGCTFFAFLFSVPGRLEVVAWVEDDLTHCRLIYRGDLELMEQIGLQLKMFEGRCFEGSDGAHEPHQHIISVPK
jgi:hypothetical protein